MLSFSFRITARRERSQDASTPRQRSGVQLGANDGAWLVRRTLCNWRLCSVVGSHVPRRAPLLSKQDATSAPSV